LKSLSGAHLNQRVGLAGGGRCDRRWSAPRRRDPGCRGLSLIQRLPEEQSEGQRAGDAACHPKSPISQPTPGNAPDKVLSVGNLFLCHPSLDVTKEPGRWVDFRIEVGGGVAEHGLIVERFATSGTAAQVPADSARTL
jgi:hypothetical protein